jgi:pimeloyl-ACP methyl ester carboxylesterase
LIDVLELEKPILLGHSIGGAVATATADAAGDRISGLILVDAVVGDRAFVEEASHFAQQLELLLQQRFAGFDDYRNRWGTLPDDSTWRRWLDRSLRMELAPLPDRTLRRRSVRDALAGEWAWITQADTLATLSRVTSPVLIVHADGPFNGKVFLDEHTLRAQLTAANDARLHVEHGRNHGDIVYWPSDELVQSVKQFAKDVRARTGERMVNEPVSAGS